MHKLIFSPLKSVIPVYENVKALFYDDKINDDCYLGALNQLMRHPSLNDENRKLFFLWYVLHDTTLVHPGGGRQQLNEPVQLRLNALVKCLQGELHRLDESGCLLEAIVSFREPEFVVKSAQWLQFLRESASSNSDSTNSISISISNNRYVQEVKLIRLNTRKERVQRVADFYHLLYMVDQSYKEYCVGYDKKRRSVMGTSSVCRLSLVLDCLEGDRMSFDNVEAHVMAFLLVDAYWHRLGHRADSLSVIMMANLTKWKLQKVNETDELRYRFLLEYSAEKGLPPVSGRLFGGECFEAHFRQWLRDQFCPLFGFIIPINMDFNSWCDRLLAVMKKIKSINKTNVIDILILLDELKGNKALYLTRDAVEAYLNDVIKNSEGEVMLTKPKAECEDKQQEKEPYDEFQEYMDFLFCGDGDSAAIPILLDAVNKESFFRAADFLYVMCFACHHNNEVFQELGRPPLFDRLLCRLSGDTVYNVLVSLIQKVCVYNTNQIDITALVQWSMQTWMQVSVGDKECKDLATMISTLNNTQERIDLIKRVARLLPERAVSTPSVLASMSELLV